jgi:hypothetical protein
MEASGMIALKREEYQTGDWLFSEIPSAARKPYGLKEQVSRRESAMGKGWLVI